MKNKGFITISLALIMLFSMPFASSAVIRMQTADQIYENMEEIPQKEIGLVLGAAVYGDRLSDILRDRMDTAIELFEAEKISLIIVSGAQYESEAMKHYAAERGIPSDSVVEDPGGVNTLASIHNISKLNRSVIIITQKFHLPRALFIANHLDIDAVGMASDKHEYIKIFDFKKRELLATTKAIFDLFLLK